MDEFAAPEHPAAEPETETELDRARPPTALAWVVIGAFVGISFPVPGILVIQTLYPELGQPAVEPPLEVMLAAFALLALAVIFLASAVALLVSWLMWVYRMNRVCRAWSGGHDLSNKPVWAVLMHFIPVLNMITVPLVVLELHRASSPTHLGASWHEDTSWGLVHVHWILAWVAFCCNGFGPVVGLACWVFWALIGAAIVYRIHRRLHDRIQGMSA